MLINYWNIKCINYYYLFINSDAEVLKRSNKELKEQMKRINEELHTIDSMGNIVRVYYYIIICNI